MQYIFMFLSENQDLENIKFMIMFSEEKVLWNT